jgi:septum formation protein
MRLYLASTSPARLATLRASGIEPFVLPSNVDEDAAVAAAAPLSPTDMVQLLARLKAEAVVDAEPDGHRVDGFILGCDSAFELDGIAYGKPHTPAVARERWALQSGREGVLHSGHWLVDHRGGVLGHAVGAVSSTAVRFADLTESEIDAYIATGEPLQVAGAFTIDSLGAAYIAEIRGDAHSVVGVSLATVRSMLVGFGVEWHSLWNRAL